MTSAKKKSLEVRFVFDHVVQLQQHLRGVPGGALIFYPVPLPVAEHAPVVVDFAVSSWLQGTLVPGTVFATLTGAMPGTWILLTTAAATAALRAIAHAPRRASRRFATDRMVRVRRATLPPQICKLSDVGNGGARLTATTSQLAADEKLELELVGGGRASSLGSARVLWADRSTAGVRFERVTPEARVAVSSLLESARVEHQHAVEVQHPAICHCVRGGPVLAPPVPRAALRDAAAV